MAPFLSVASHDTLLILDAPALKFVSEYDLSLALVEDEMRRIGCSRALLWYSRGATNHFLTRRGWVAPEGHGVLEYVL